MAIEVSATNATNGSPNRRADPWKDEHRSNGAFREAKCCVNDLSNVCARRVLSEIVKVFDPCSRGTVKNRIFSCQKEKETRGYCPPHPTPLLYSMTEFRI